MNGHNLEQLAHLLLMAQPVDSFFKLRDPLRVCRRKARRAGTDAQAIEPFTLRNDRSHRRPCLNRRAAESLEIDVRRDILLPNIDKDGHVAVPFDGLERIARRAFLMAASASC